MLTYFGNEEIREEDKPTKRKEDDCEDRYKCGREYSYPKNARFYRRNSEASPLKSKP